MHYIVVPNRTNSWARYQNHIVAFEHLPSIYGPMSKYESIFHQLHYLILIWEISQIMVKFITTLSFNIGVNKSIMNYDDIRSCSISIVIYNVVATIMSKHYIRYISSAPINLSAGWPPYVQIILYDDVVIYGYL